jgi:hypothetical protein
LVQSVRKARLVSPVQMAQSARKVPLVLMVLLVRRVLLVRKVLPV